jgi:hypothetical protein
VRIWESKNAHFQPRIVRDLWAKPRLQFACSSRPVCLLLAPRWKDLPQFDQPRNGTLTTIGWNRCSVVKGFLSLHTLFTAQVQSERARISQPSVQFVPSLHFADLRASKLAPNPATDSRLSRPTRFQGHAWAV